MPNADEQQSKRRLWAVLLVALVLPSAITGVYFFGADDATAGVQVAAYSIVKVLQFALPVVWVFGVERRPMSLRWPSTRGVGIGLAFGIAILAAAAALYLAFLKPSQVMAEAAGPIRDKVAGFGLTSVWRYAVFAVFCSFIHSWLEEYYWRWFVFGELKKVTSPVAAGIVSSIGFAAHHVLVLGKYFGFAAPATYLLSACVAIGGLVWAWLYHRTDSLLGPWVSHICADLAIFAIGYDIVRAQLG